VLRT